MAAPTYVSASSATRGVASAETGINIGSFRERFDNPKEYLLDRFNGRIGMATDYDTSSTATIEGEVTTALTAVMAVAQATATTLANSVVGYGIATGDHLLDDIEISQDRGSWATASLNFTRIEGMTVA